MYFKTEQNYLPLILHSRTRKSGLDLGLTGFTRKINVQVLKSKFTNRNKQIQQNQNLAHWSRILSEL